MIRILLADDHALLREGLKQLFSLTSDLTIVTEATNGAQVLNALHHERFDLVLLDLTMPGLSGPELITRILAQDNAPPILVLSMHNETQVARRVLAAGAAGYLTKDNNPEILLAAIRKVASGQRFFDPALAEAMAFEASHAIPAPDHERLSGREFQILCLLARGIGVNEIAAQLSISNKTVSTHKARLMEKMGFTSNAHLVRYAISYDLID